jgi:pimeloyl-ACP methyl ester carboxylesterase
LNRLKSVSLFLAFVLNVVFNVVFNASAAMLFTAAFGATAFAVAGDNSITSSKATVKGVELHFLKAGHGPALILLHGYAETSLMWKPIMPALSERFSVIAPDLPGIGDSAIPANGLDMKSAATLIHELARSLGIQKAEVVGHDIGLMVAYAYAAQFPAEVQKLVLMDAFLPGVGDWTSIYNSPNYWHFRFHGPTPEALVQGRERIYFDYYWNDFAADKNRSLPEADRKAYAAAYARPGRMRAGWAYFTAFPQTAQDFAQLSQTKLTMPVLVIGGEKSLGVPLAEETKLVALDVTVVVIKNSGHWVLEESPKETTDALQKFL